LVSAFQIGLVLSNQIIGTSGMEVFTMHGKGKKPKATNQSKPVKSILIEGWRTTNHSFALVNQYQICALKKLTGVSLFHHDLPLHGKHWESSNKSSGFSHADRIGIDGMRKPAGKKIDCVYRITSPFQAPAAADDRKTITFIVSELGLGPASFAAGSEAPGAFTRDENLVVTASSWARDRLTDWGFSGDKIMIVPHGVDRDSFRPPSAAQRDASRKVLGIADGEMVFMNVGAAIWVKGVDLLLLAFAKLRTDGRKIRLVLRDRADMYGTPIIVSIGKLAAKYSGLFTPDTMAAIMVISEDVSRDQMRHLYGAADCYVSPYRAEGFNLPVLEAIACGTPAIVTRGGATDEFCNDQVAIRIHGKSEECEMAAGGLPGRYITPDINELMDAMDSFARGQNAGLDHFDQAREALVAKYSWKNAAVQLASLAVGYGGVSS
jgi:glycosyltransferase involved in cell wall biosynthesis